MKDGVEGVLKLVEVVRVTGRKFGMEGERKVCKKNMLLHRGENRK